MNCTQSHGHLCCRTSTMARILVAPVMHAHITSSSSFDFVHMWLAFCPRAACAGTCLFVLARRLQLQLLLSLPLSLGSATILESVVACCGDITKTTISPCMFLTDCVFGRRCVVCCVSPMSVFRVCVISSTCSVSMFRYACVRVSSWS